ncbi:MAG: nucleoside triphosphate pyrophosphohydrolase [Saprospiraceae bacterium]|nr:nucleoside triphosphate pyrophosphohydrolase [Saprospiraceae bacterium]
MDPTAAGFLRLLTIMDDLREKCPWDKKQSFESLRPLTLEECYEMLDAIGQGQPEPIKEELGDLLLHIAFYARLTKEQFGFGMKEVLEALCDKLVRRHPHIYADVQLEDADAVKRNWEKLKLAEKKRGLLDGVPDALPSLLKSMRMQDKARQVGFDWEHASEVREKVNEEMIELDAAIQSGIQPSIQEEFGDLLFALVNYGRFLGIDADSALNMANGKFRRRLGYMEANSSRPLSELGIEELEMLWQSAKKEEKSDF